MPRFLLAYTLIALVLVCPYQCLAGVVREAGETQASSACHCCHPPQSGEEPVTPAPNESSNEHGCLCQGATVDAPRDSAADLNLLVVAIQPQACVTSDLLSLQVFASTAHGPPTKALAPSGWDICVLQCALLL